MAKFDIDAQPLSGVAIIATTDRLTTRCLSASEVDGLFVAHFNFCRVHEALRVTPAMAQRLTDHVWTNRRTTDRLPRKRAC